MYLWDEWAYTPGVRVVQRRKKKPKDVRGMGRRWSGWRGMYADTSHLNGPVVVKKLATEKK